jgi:hypothetical protein
VSTSVTYAASLYEVGGSHGGGDFDVGFLGSTAIFRAEMCWYLPASPLGVIAQNYIIDI